MDALRCRPSASKGLVQGINQVRGQSAFSPVVSPSRVPWGIKALTAYLGNHPEDWKEWDCVELIRQAQERLPLLVDQGLADEFLESQLKPHLLAEACQVVNHPLQLRMHPGYDHSYYFISTFLPEHVAWHAARLK